MALTYSADLGIFNRLRDDLTLWTRRGIFHIFMRECAPGPQSRVADFGVSGHRSHPVHYFFEALYPYKRQLTAIGRASEEAGWLSEQFPEIGFLEADLRALPLPDMCFDYGICNAVIEHAGPSEQQATLVREVCRVCRCVLFTTPNRWFPIEWHTGLPLLHWLPVASHRAALQRIGYRYFADIQNLHLLDGRAFRALFPASRRNRMFRIGLPLLATNLICISSCDPR